MYAEHVNNGKMNGLAPIVSGGAPLALNLQDPKDLATLRQAIERWPGRWKGMNETLRSRYLKQLEIATDEADLLAQNPETLERAATLRASIVKTAVAIDSLQQRDEHKIMDAILGTGRGGSTTNTQVNVQADNVTLNVPAPRVIGASE